MLQASDFINWVYVWVQYSWGSFLQTNSRLDASGAALVNEYFSCPLNLFLLEIHALSNSNLTQSLDVQILLQFWHVINSFRELQ